MDAYQWHLEYYYTKQIHKNILYDRASHQDEMGNSFRIVS